MRVVVVGAGIGGLVAAIGFRAAGADVTVLERAPQLEPAGAGISLFGNGLAGLAAIGLADPVRALGGSVPAGVRAALREPSGRELAAAPVDAENVQVVHRAELQRVLLAALPAGTVRCGVTVAGVDRSEDWCVALDASGVAVADGDLLVGADGARSAVRAAWPGDPGLRGAGWTAWRAVTKPPRPVNAVGETWGRGRLFGITLLGDGRVYWFAGTRGSAPGDGAGDGDAPGAAAPGATPGVGDGDAPVTPVPGAVPGAVAGAARQAELARLFTGWHHPIPDLIAATPPHDVLHHEIVTLARPLRSFVTGRVALVGDAAHPMAPNLGQGGNQAIEDAVTLVRLVSRPGADLDGALVRYDALRRRRTAAIVRRSALLGRVALVQGGLAVGARTLLVRATPGAAMARGARAVQRWQPPSW